MAKRARTYTVRRAYSSGVRDGMLGALRGGSFGAAPVRIHKSVGSPVTDRAARYGDVAKIKRDVDRAEQVDRRRD